MHFLASAFARPAGSALARQHMHAWAYEVTLRLSELGLDIETVGARQQVGADATHLVLARRKNDVAGVHATISVSIDDRHLEVAVQLPVPDVPAARVRLTDPLHALELSTALEALPEQFAIGMVGDEHPAPASRASTDDVRALLARAEGEQRALWLGWSVSRDVAAEHAQLLDEQLQDAAVALASVFAMLVSASDGSTANGGAPRRREKHDRNRADDERRAPERRARKPDRARERERERDASPDLRESDGSSAGLARSTGSIPPAPSGTRARPGRAVRPAKGAGEIEKGSRVRVLEGPFSGKVGVVQEIDRTGGAGDAGDAGGVRAARVMLGLLAVRVDVRDLAPCAAGRARPVLSTSHRKRSAVRS